MSSNEQLIEQIGIFTESLLNDSALFLLEVTIKPSNKVIVFIDGDFGANIEALVKINRALRKKMEEAELFPNGDFSLDVSSPGIDTPLKLHRQYVKNIGRDVRVKLTDDSELKGLLKGVDEKEIVLEKYLTIKQKENKEESTIIIAFDNIKSTTVELKF